MQQVQNLFKKCFWCPWFTANETVTWSLNGGADAALFEIDSSSGTLSFKTAPDYETPTDAM